MTTIQKYHLTECPRDAMQGLAHFVPTALKAAYLNILLKVGFDTLDFGSFVSPKAIPQMRDTAEVLSLLDLDSSATKLLSIVANLRGAEEAVVHAPITYLGFPFSISETFQQRNTNSSIAASLETVKKMLSLCDQHDKTALIYLSMGFGNPYGDEWNAEIVEHWTSKLVDLGVRHIAIADTTGMATPESIGLILPPLLQKYGQTEIGLHLHSTPSTRLSKIEAGIAAGCTRFDSALKGFGGCPMAKDELTGNLATEDLIALLERRGEVLGLDKQRWQEAMDFSTRIFSH